MNKKRLLPALLALALLLPALSAAASAVEVETYVNVAVGSPYTATTPYIPSQIRMRMCRLTARS